jgi:hypothetical protein
MQPDVEQQPQANESIFNDLVDLAPYEKSLKNARIWLYIITGLQFAMGLFEYFTIDDNIIAAVAFGIDAFVAMSFLILALWSKKKPLIAFSIALGFYALFLITFTVLDPSNLFKGLIMKILVTIALIKAVRDAKQYEEVRASISNNQ